MTSGTLPLATAPGTWSKTLLCWPAAVIVRVESPGLSGAPPSDPPELELDELPPLLLDPPDDDALLEVEPDELVDDPPDVELPEPPDDEEADPLSPFPLHERRKRQR